MWHSCEITPWSFQGQISRFLFKCMKIALLRTWAAIEDSCYCTLTKKDQGLKKGPMKSLDLLCTSHPLFYFKSLFQDQCSTGSLSHFAPFPQIQKVVGGGDFFTSYDNMFMPASWL